MRGLEYAVVAASAALSVVALLRRIKRRGCEGCGKKNCLNRR